MEISTVIGSLGVTLLLVAFIFNLIKVFDEDHPGYAIMNIIGAGLACYSSILIRFIPFVILEGFWCLAALLSLVRIIVKKKKKV